MTDRPWLSLSAYARTYGIARGTVYKWLRSGLLESYHAGAVVRVKNQPPLLSSTVQPVAHHLSSSTGTSHTAR